MGQKQKYKRYAKGGRFKQSGEGLRSSVSQIAKQRQTEIDSLKLQQLQHQRISQNQIAGFDRKFTKEQQNSQQIQDLETKIYNNKIKNLNIRADREVENLLGQAKAKQQESEFWSGVASDFGGALAKQAGNLYKAYEFAEAQKRFESEGSTDFFEAFDANDEQQRKVQQDLLDNIALHGSKFSDDDVKTSISSTFGRSSASYGRQRASEFRDNKEVIVGTTSQSTDSKGNRIWNKDTASKLLIARAYNFLDKHKISPYSKAGRQILSDARKWGNAETWDLDGKHSLKNDTAQLFSQSKTIASIYKGLSSNPSKEDLELLATNVTGYIEYKLRATISGTKPFSFIRPKDHKMSLPEAASALAKELKEADPSLTFENIEDLFSKVQVPWGRGKYKDDTKKAEKKWNILGKLGQSKFIDNLRESPDYNPDNKFESGDAKKIFIEQQLLAQKEGRPDWLTSLTGGGWLDDVEDSFNREAKAQENRAKSTKSANAQVDIKKWKESIKNDPTILTDPEKRNEAKLRATAVGVDSTYANEIFKDLDWNKTTHGDWAASELFKKAVRSGDIDEATYYFTKLNPAAREAHADDMDGIEAAYKAGVTVKSVRERTNGFIDDEHKANLIGKAKNSTTKGAKDAAEQRWWYYYNRLGNIEDTTARIEKADALVADEIKAGVKEGTGIFAATPISKDNDTLVWDNFTDGSNTTSTVVTKGNAYDILFNPEQQVEGEDTYDRLKNILTPKEKIQLELRAQRGDNSSIPENVTLAASYLNMTEKQVIDVILNKTRDNKSDIEIEWTADVNDLSGKLLSKFYKRKDIPGVMLGTEYFMSTGELPMRDYIRNQDKYIDQFNQIGLDPSDFYQGSLLGDVSMEDVIRDSSKSGFYYNPFSGKLVKLGGK
tara:strand:+ start:158 stop:2830 length:2673 start_codon:yes stop_codon:yes gene_type:complete